MKILVQLLLSIIVITASYGEIAAPIKKKKKKRVPPTTPAEYVGVHPLFALENIDTAGRQVLRIGGMCFHGEDLYVTTLTPDRLNRAPDKKGKVLRVENVTQVKEGGAELKVTTLCDWLYEPCAIAVVGDSVYVGEKDRIIRFDGAVHKDRLEKGEEIVLLDGASTPNFHTYTVGFELYEKEGETYLCGNFTTAVLSGGKRDVMVPPNPSVHRGSTFTLGPINGKEDASSVKLDFLAGGYRTPNGIGIGGDNAVWVTDNQGIFNPSNELIRVEKSKFYGHYLKTEDGRMAAFQPKEIDPVAGSPVGQVGATVHLPQNIVARSPAQPIVLDNLSGVLQPYEGQLLVCEFTTGRLLRVFPEKVDGVWQGAVFQHSGGPADAKGNNGFTAGPNRIVKGPDGHYYIGHIGVGGLWIYNNTRHGLQRLRVRSEEEVPESFNEILAVRVVDGGFELEFLKPIPADSIDKNSIEVAQWTYHPSKSYGGKDVDRVKLRAASVNFDSTGKKATVIVNGLKDGSDRYIVTNPKTGSSNHNTGYVVHMKFDPKQNGVSLLRANEFWYTLHKKIGGKDAESGDRIELTKLEKTQQHFQSLCMACHVELDSGWGAPDLRGILGRKQAVLRDGEEVEVTVDRNYIIEAILKPDGEKSLAFKDVAMPPLGLSREQAEELADYIISLK